MPLHRQKYSSRTDEPLLGLYQTRIQQRQITWLPSRFALTIALLLVAVITIIYRGFAAPTRPKACADETVVPMGSAWYICRGDVIVKSVESIETYDRGTKTIRCAADTGSFSVPGDIHVTYTDDSGLSHRSRVTRADLVCMWGWIHSQGTRPTEVPVSGFA